MAYTEEQVDEKFRQLVKDYCTKTFFTDETGNDETLIYNMRFMAFGAGFRAALQLLSNENPGTGAIKEGEK